MKKNLKIKQKGSALVFTMILITNAVIIVSSIVFLASMQNKASGSLFLTTKAFQKADGGLEYALMKINDKVWETGGYDSSIANLGLCSSFNTTNGECKVNNILDGDISIWFYEKSPSDNVITSNSTAIGEVGDLKIQAKVVDGSNRVSRSLKVSLFASP